ncbi:MAG TPA: hypothetical protein VGR26_13910 [Acidimicrobiales bacterium]|nr:hypothetical protein [Acidimicrobiales bacterium]
MDARQVLAALVCTTLVAGGCGDDDVDPEVTFDAPRAGAVLFEDEFDDDTEGWGTTDTDEIKVSFEDGDYVWAFKLEPNPHLLPATIGDAFDAGTLEMQDVVVRASATVEAGEAVVGVWCREVRDDDAEFKWYEFMVRNGFAAIRLADSEGNIEELASTKDVNAPLGEAMVIAAGCVDGDDGTAQLTLTLNDELVLRAADDDPLGNGGAGLGAYEAPQAEDASVVRWHDFSVSQVRS